MPDSLTQKIPQALADTHRQCFACGECNQGGLNLHFEIGEDGSASGVWQPSDVFRSYPDRIHGGVIATLMDSAIVHALFAREIAGLTAELTIRYLCRINLHDPVHVRGWVEGSRRRIYQCRAEVHQAGVLAVRATAKFMAMPAGS
ncbi:MAG: hypothetical protein BGO12_08225 [Verrucomicrobia bacterium 61-8]|nr:PaaI family thioesterase [Verrucomicrobiota bacterium]OJV03120.1 MAG: hypothetical protein BGO12_08225 [Verrucomicrobia bacterium 61-8]